MELKNQVAIVTGAASGIGAATSVKLAEQGATVVLVDLNSCDNTISRMQQVNENAVYLQCAGDIKDHSFVKSTVDDTISHFNKVDILVNNAGTCCRDNLEQITEEQWDRDMNTNAKAAFLFIKACVYPHMKEGGYGRIINISSVSGINGGVVSGDDGSGRSGAAYSASKGAVIALTKWVAKEIGSLGITCNSVAPGATETGITKDVSYGFNQQVINRMGTPEEIARGVCFLAAPDAGYITAQTLRIDGGISIG